jgi:hypothetical protein
MSELQSQKGDEFLISCKYNYDCLHCPLPDCNCSERITPAEQEIIKGASGKWERDVIDKNVSYMLKHRYKADEIRSMLGLSQKDYNTAYQRILHEKSRSPVRAGKAAKIKTF